LHAQSKPISFLVPKETCIEEIQTLAAALNPPFSEMSTRREREKRKNTYQTKHPPNKTPTKQNTHQTKHPPNKTPTKQNTCLNPRVKLIISPQPSYQIFKKYK